MTHRDRRPSAVFLIPAASIVGLVIWAVLNPDSAVGLVQRSGGLLAICIAAMLAFSGLLYAFLKARRQASVWTASLVSSAAVHVVGVMLFLLLAEPEDSVSILPAEDRYRLSSPPPTLRENSIGRELREQLVAMEQPALRPIEEKKAPRKDEPELTPVRAHAELTEVKREAPVREVLSAPNAAPQVKDIREELSGKSQHSVDSLPVKIVKVTEVESPKDARVPEGPRDTRDLALAPVRRSSVSLKESAPKQEPSKAQTASREPARPKPEQVRPVDPDRARVEESLKSKDLVARIDKLAVPAARTPLQAGSAKPGSALQPQNVELPHQALAISEKSQKRVAAPEKPAALVQPKGASLVKAESSALAARKLSPAERLAPDSRRKDQDAPVKLQGTVVAIARPASTVSKPEAAGTRPKSVAQDKAKVAASSTSDLGEKPRVEVNSASEAPSGTLVGKLRDEVVRQEAVVPLMEDRVESSPAGRPMPLTQAVGGKVATVAGSEGGGAQPAAPAGPASISAARVQTGLTATDAPSLLPHPVKGVGGVASAPGARDSTLVEAGAAAGQTGSRVPSVKDAGLARGSSTAAGSAQGLPDMAPGVAPLKRSSAKGGPVAQVADRRNLGEARAQGGAVATGEATPRPAPELSTELTNAVASRSGKYAVADPEGPGASLPMAESLKGAESGAPGRDMVRVGIAMAAVETGDARSEPSSAAAAGSPRDLAATKVARNADVAEPASGRAGRGRGALAKDVGPAGQKQGTLVQADSELRAAAREQSAGLPEGGLKGAGSSHGPEPIAAVGAVSGAERTDAAGGAPELTARTTGQRDTLSAGKAAGPAGAGGGELARPSRDIPAGTAVEDRSLAGRAVPSASGDASAGIEDNIGESATDGTLASDDVGLTSVSVAARTDVAQSSGGSGTGSEPNRPANVALARAGRTSGASDRTARPSAPLGNTGGESQSAERLVGDSGEPAVTVAGPEMAGSSPSSAQAGARSADAVPVVFAVSKAGPAGGKGGTSIPDGGIAPTDGVGQMIAAKATGGVEGSTAGDQPRREAPSSDVTADRAPARLDVAFDLDSAASGNVRSVGPSEAARLPSSTGAHKGLLSVGTAPSPESVPEKAIYQMRKPEKRKEFIAELGGTPESENAVEHGLAWLAKAQSEDGRWNLREFNSLRECGGAGDLATEDPAMTGLVLLSFLGAGYTHTEGAYKDNVRKGLEWIMNGQTEAGDLRGGGTMYGQAIAAAALCESYSLTGDDRLIGPARLAIEFILRAQNPEAGWRYEPRVDSDTSVTGWQILALKSAQIAGIKIPQEHFKWTGMWMDKVRKGREGGLYCYKPGHAVTPVMTAEGWFCQLFMSDQSEARGQAESISYVMGNLPVWAPGDRAVHLYYWYYATLSMYLSGCSEFKQWNEALRTALLKGQVKGGAADGSWDPVDQLGPRGGRVYTTAAATLCLEVYYRFLPIYKMPKRTPGQ